MAAELLEESRALREQQLRSANPTLLVPPNELQIIFNPRDGSDPRNYDLPVANEVAALFTTDADGLVPEAYITVHERGKDIRRIRYIDPMLEPAAFPLIYPAGCKGYTLGIPLQAPDGKRKDASRREYCCWRMAVREGQFNPLHHCGRLFQEWAVSMFAFMEGDRMNFYRLHQKELKADSYNLQHFLEGLEFDGNPTIGKAIILPATYPGSPRYWTNQFEDAMAIVRYYGRPDIFLTMTCNPSWPEVREVITVTLDEGEEFEEYSTDRPDIIARVFDMKKDALMAELREGRCFGELVAWIFVIEFQKRGLPHLHAILTLKDADKIRTAEEVDRCISAQLPDEDTEKELFDLVTKHHIHGPNCRTNPHAMCKDAKGLCRWNYPKPYNPTTRITEDGRVYCARPDNGRSTAVMVRNEPVPATNKDVAPFCPRLLLKFRCHVYVDLVQDHMAIKYLYKYCTKGPDKAKATIRNDTVVYDEINLHVDSRCVTPPEAMWRLQGRPLIGKSHSTQKLDIHLSGKKAYFRLNEEDAFARDLYYSQVPEFYTLKVEDGSGASVIRTLSHGATSFEQLYWVGEERCATYAIACLRRGITSDDSEWDRTLEEAVGWKSCAQLRHFFALVIVHCRPKEPYILWEKYKRDFSEDYMRTMGEEEALSAAYKKIAEHLARMGKPISEIPTMQPVPQAEWSLEEIDVEAELREAQALYDQLTDAQRAVVDRIIELLLGVNDPTLSKCAYISGHAGTGKSFTYRCIFHLVRALGYRCVATASTGIASTVLPAGRTWHSLFKLPVPITSSTKCPIERSAMLENVDVFILDEAPMMSRFGIECVDDMLRKLHKNPNVPFGGKV
ncbi:hypothetical protein AAVH_35240, partial [Aphelenchoides avenae]